MKRICRMMLGGMLCLFLCLQMPVCADAESVYIDKVLVTVSNTPVVMMDISSVYAETSTAGCYIADYAWINCSSGSAEYGTFGENEYRLDVVIKAMDGLYFTDDVSVYLNNSPVYFYLSGGSTTLTLSRAYTPELWVPTVIKHPGDEHIESGELASFVASASYADRYEWFVASPEGVCYSAYDIPNLFSDTYASGVEESKMNIHNVPEEMNGWTVFCTFTGPGGKANSNSALLTVGSGTVAAAVNEELKDAETVEESPEPEYSIPEDAVIVDEPEETAAPHIHSYPEIWRYDDSMHWRECECGEKSAFAEHDIVWETVTEATKKHDGTEKGVCSVCGYTIQRAVEYSGMSESSGGGIVKIALIAVGAFAALTIVILAAGKNNRRKKHKRKAKYSGKH